MKHQDNLLQMINDCPDLLIMFMATTNKCFGYVMDCVATSKRKLAWTRQTS